MFSSCVPLGTTIAVDTNLPIQTTRITVLNTTPYSFSVLVDGEEKGLVKPYGKFSCGLWNGSYYGVELAVSVVGSNCNFAQTEKVWIWSSYSRYSYVFTIRQEEDGRMWLERR
ncbi:MAG TPA: hypothetical protein PLX73_01815 [Candidatus Paceibacterota bacterium]|nr:hypothetical protein [Candidatus Paceibacterota bacterium]HOL54107.1 hypothetical protein [Candidatus Paceibacterota bacterium]HON21885.1 hypothetical protein [Candidatus Paceibacterota bacterium]HPP17098.1 hypothetical protein [Candidatus Paceibacterota bacterium]